MPKRIGQPREELFVSEYETVKYEQDDSVAIITINRPDAMNSFDAALRRDLLAACEKAADDSTVFAPLY